MRKLAIFVLIALFTYIGISAYIVLNEEEHKKTITRMTTAFNNEKKKLNDSIKELQQNIKDMQDSLSKGYKLKVDVYPGDILLDEMLEEVSVNNSLITDNTKFDISEYLGNYRFKTSYKASSLLSKDMLMNTLTSKDLMWIEDLVPTYFQKGIEPGKWIQVRCCLPGGSELVVLDKKQVQEINSETIRVFVSETEKQKLKSMRTDYEMYNQYGFTWYVSLYNEPFLDDNNVAMYFVREDMYDLINLNRDIPDKSTLINKELRKRIDAEIQQAANGKMNDTDKLSIGANAGSIVSGNNDYATKISQAYDEYIHESEEAEKQANKNDTGTGASGLFD